MHQRDLKAAAKFALDKAFEDRVKSIFNEQCYRVKSAIQVTADKINPDLTADIRSQLQMAAKIYDQFRDVINDLDDHVDE